MLTSALFATAVGTGLGTIVGFTAVMYPVGIVLGASPAVLMGAIFSGAAFGDNLAPISDTTIVSAATQETDVGGVVRARALAKRLDDADLVIIDKRRSGKQ